jgi:hypothetical protein
VIGHGVDDWPIETPIARSTSFTFDPAPNLLTKTDARSAFRALYSYTTR